MRSMVAPAEPLGELLAAVDRGDVGAFRRLYDATSGQLLGILVGRMGRRDLTEEALQECFIKIWQKAGSYHPAPGQAMPWLATLACNQAVDLIRARRPDESGPDLEIELAGWADEGADPCRDAEQAQHLRQPLAALAPRYAPACC